MLSLAHALESQLRAAIDRAFPEAAASARVSGTGWDPQLAPASKPEFGDFQANAALPLAKPLKSQCFVPNLAIFHLFFGGLPASQNTFTRIDFR